MVNLIGSLLDRNDSIASIVSSRFRTLIGNGSNLDFWVDNWTGMEELKVLFPWIFALAVSKHGLVSSFGRWEDDTWIWMVYLHRRPFD